MDTSTLLCEFHPPVVTLTLNRPQAHNMFNAQFVTALQTILDEIALKDEIRVVVIRAKGKNFCAGADLHWMQEMANAPLDQNQQDAARLAQLFYTLGHFEKPIISLLQGGVIGGGIGLVATSDIAIADSSVWFCFSEAKIGYIPATIAPYIIRSIGYRQTARYFLTAEKITPTKALQIGLIHEIAQTTALETTYQTCLQTLLQNGPEALKATKKLLQLLYPIHPSMKEKTAQLLAEIRASKEGQARVSAYLNKKSPT